MLQELKNMIAACQENIIKYQAIDDQAAVKAAQGMIADFEEILAHEMDMINNV